MTEDTKENAAATAERAEHPKDRARRRGEQAAAHYAAKIEFAANHGANPDQYADKTEGELEALSYELTAAADKLKARRVAVRVAMDRKIVARQAAAKVAAMTPEERAAAGVADVTVAADTLKGKVKA